MKRALLLCLILFITTIARAQDAPPAKVYMDKVTEGQQQITEDFLSYTSAIAHGKTARKIEKRRKELVTAVEQARSRIKALPDYDGDTTVKSAAYNYYTVDYNLLNNDYAKIVDMEEIAEESYDNMEAYLLAEEKADEKLNQSFARWDTAFKVFAGKHNIKLLEDNSTLSKKSAEVAKVNTYYHQVYLIFFKSYKQDMYLTAAVNKKDINGIEQNKTTLLKNTGEGLEKLNKVHAFEDDADLVAACRKALLFFEREAKTSVPVISDFLVKNDNFEKLKKAMDGGSHSKEDVDNYNKAVRDMNGAVSLYNKVNKQDNDERTRVIEDWNTGGQAFLGKHTPRYNKLLDSGAKH